jgi:PhzF family phenazine biosynthesis protein
VRRLAAFTDRPDGGNPAGVVIADHLPAPATMQRVAAEVGYSETAFLAGTSHHASRFLTRYFSPAAEVDFCGHATIAAGVLLGELHGPGSYLLETNSGEVPVGVRRVDGGFAATLTSVAPRHRPIDDELLRAVLATLGWSPADLDPSLPPAVAYAGAWHLVLTVAERRVLAALDYDFAALREIMLREGWTTLELLWRESPAVFHARAPFPVGGVVEDPATGAAAAALGGYLRDAGLLAAPADLLVRQGEDLGRPSLLRVRVPSRGGIQVSGTAVPLPG